MRRLSKVPQEAKRDHGSRGEAVCDASTLPGRRGSAEREGHGDWTGGVGAHPLLVGGVFCQVMVLSEAVRTLTVPPPLQLHTGHAVSQFDLGGLYVAISPRWSSMSSWGTLMHPHDRSNQPQSLHEQDCRRAGLAQIFRRRCVCERWVGVLLSLILVPDTEALSPGDRKFVSTRHGRHDRAQRQKDAEFGHVSARLPRPPVSVVRRPLLALASRLGFQFSCALRPPAAFGPVI